MVGLRVHQCIINNKASIINSLIYSTIYIVIVYTLYTWLIQDVYVNCDLIIYGIIFTFIFLCFNEVMYFLSINFIN